MPEYIDWTDPRWPHTPTAKGIPYPVLMTPQSAAKILDKAGKKKAIGMKMTKGSVRVTARAAPIKR